MVADRLVSELARHLSSPNGAQGFAPVLLALLDELSNGHPVPLDSLARRAGLSATRLRALLRQAEDTEWDEAGNVVGYGLTLGETGHRFEVEGRNLYTWCAFDTLFFPPLMGKTAKVNSMCAVTRTPVTLEVSPEQLISVQPPEAAVSLVLPSPGARIRNTFCCNVHYFASGVAAGEWAQRRGNTEILDVQSAFEIGKAVAQTLRRMAS